MNIRIFIGCENLLLAINRKIEHIAKIQEEFYKFDLNTERLNEEGVKEVDGFLRKKENP